MSSDAPFGQEIPEAVRAEVVRRLQDIEREHGVRVLFACESGSRAWGFPSRDSDFDVRFLYLRPTADYLSPFHARQRDVIEPPIVDEFDLSGWDLRKALVLFERSNPPLLEWLDSPIVYRESTALARGLRRLRSTFYSPKASAHHYLSMARGNLREYLTGEEVWTKKYFYVLRPLLGVLWVERGLGPVPMRFDLLVAELITDTALRRAIDDLVVQKRAGEELRRGPRIELISSFLDRELARLETTLAPSATEPRDSAQLEDLFLDTLVEVWGAGLARSPECSTGT